MSLAPKKMKAVDLFACVRRNGDPPPDLRTWPCPGPMPEHPGCDAGGWAALEQAAKANSVKLVVCECGPGLSWDFKSGGHWYGPEQCGDAKAFALIASYAQWTIAACIDRVRQ